MTVQLSSPEGLLQPVPYHHVAVGRGTRQVHVAGQIARDGAGNPVAPDDLAGQVEQVLRNAARGLASADADFTDVVRMRFFVTHWQPARITDFMAGIERVAAELGIPQPLPPASLIGVDVLFAPDVLVELEVEAVLD